MRNINPLLLSFLVLGLTVQGQPCKKNNEYAFDRGEKMTYRVAFYSALTGNIVGGEATLELKQTNKKFENRNTYHAVVEGRTTGLIEVFYKVNDRLESYFDEENLYSWQFLRRIRENNYKRDDMVTFSPKAKLAISMTKTLKVPADINDIVSVYYYARTLDLNNYTIGSSIAIPFYLDDSVYNSRIIIDGKAQIKTKLGKFNCIVIKPMVATGYTFDNPYPITVWITDDEKKIPVLIETKLSVGRARVELIDYSGTLKGRK